MLTRTATRKEKGGGRERLHTPTGHREGAGKFFPLGCRQKGNYFNCGQPRSTNPFFLTRQKVVVPLSLSLLSSLLPFCPKPPPPPPFLYTHPTYVYFSRLSFTNVNTLLTSSLAKPYIVHTTCETV